MFINILLSFAIGAFCSVHPPALGGKFRDNLPKPKSSEINQEHFWQSKLDNFDPSSTETYDQRYWVDDQFFDPEKGLVFLEIDGEWTNSNSPDGYVFDLGRNYSALLISLEHRFYGDSIPNNDLSTENLKYLTVEQALADAASFIDGYSNDLKSSTWFIFGGSYAGALVAWFRIAYPDSTVGALSSSGVIKAVLHYNEFDQEVSTAVGSSCANAIRSTQTALTNSVASGNFDGLLTEFGCEADMTVGDFYYMVADYWSMSVQYGSKNALCSAITPNAGDNDAMVISRYAEFVESFWGESACSCFYDSECMADPARYMLNDDNRNGRCWHWQTCLQLAYFQVAPSYGSLRSADVNLEYHLSQCRTIFGIDMMPSVAQFNYAFGGSQPSTGSKIFYSDFSDDPWQTASATYPLAQDQPLFLAHCDGCSHCDDLHQPREDDPQVLVDCRLEFEGYLKDWLNY